MIYSYREAADWTLTFLRAAREQAEGGQGEEGVEVGSGLDALRDAYDGDDAYA